MYLDRDLELCAQYHIDKHCNKLILECAQCLCTAHWETGGTAPYRKTHINHPTSVWCRTSLPNYRWAVQYGFELCKEFEYRFKKTHKTKNVLNWLRDNEPNIPDIGFTNFYQAMPDKYRKPDPIEAYRLYYRSDKKTDKNGKNMLVYTGRKIPDFML
jgi:hypothetical protein